MMEASETVWLAPAIMLRSVSDFTPTAVSAAVVMTLPSGNTNPSVVDLSLGAETVFLEVRSSLTMKLPSGLSCTTGASPSMSSASLYISKIPSSSILIPNVFCLSKPVRSRSSDGRLAEWIVRAWLTEVPMSSNPLPGCWNSA
eukprot:CAMPEP_0118639414 /NCGR_PEP_ID=MMETSP0785-20121206/4208_1 /TAXON_ID=91992 /ORGANISM="Bolidomonas pacifica, Strain CCMP 1866" /LENGTH=142 /DNA_ID=CAMNT_0006530735 /DNA_START=332 /DNA_END=760 /DNA_ORIENTATION=-